MAFYWANENREDYTGVIMFVTTPFTIKIILVFTTKIIQTFVCVYDKK